MKLKNYTDIDNELIREIIRFVKPSDVSRFDIQIKNTPGIWKGRAYTQGCAYHCTAAPLVNVYVGKYDSSFPHKTIAEGAYIGGVWIYSRIEALIFVTAHELRHLWQAKHPHGWRVWGARGQFSERDADAYAIKMLRAWRRM